jgi:hypothetical protein
MTPDTVGQFRAYLAAAVDQAQRDIAALQLGDRRQRRQALARQLARALLPQVLAHYAARRALARPESSPGDLEP